MDAVQQFDSVTDQIYDNLWLMQNVDNLENRYKIAEHIKGLQKKQGEALEAIISEHKKLSKSI